MNYLRTAFLFAALTALFMGIGYLFGGAGRSHHPGAARRYDPAKGHQPHS